VNTGNSLRVAGWAVDPQSLGPVEIHVYVDGQISGLLANRTRGDLGPHLGSWGADHAFDGTIAAAPGPRNVCVYAINVGPGNHVGLGCRTVNVLPPRAARPFGSFDIAASVDGEINVAGWAIDPDTAGPIDVHVYVDGAIAGGTRADRTRSDVGALFPGSGPNHGFDARFPAAPGVHNVCTYAINDGPPDHTFLGCKTMTVTPKNSTPPFGSVDVVTRTNGSVRVAGWAIDPDDNAPIDVHVYVGASGAGVTADRSRTDVQAVFNRGDRHGFEVVLPIPAAPTRVCVYGINNSGVGPNSLIACRTI
jgi:hypothetical protein